VAENHSSTKYDITKYVGSHNHYGRNKVCRCHYGTMRSIVRLIVMGRLCELCMILLVDSMLVYVFLRCMLFYAVAWGCCPLLLVPVWGDGQTRLLAIGVRVWLRERGDDGRVAHSFLEPPCRCVAWVVRGF
jgi:hypothetical protein